MKGSGRGVRAWGQRVSWIVGLTACRLVAVSFAAIVQRELLYIYERNESVVQGLINYKKFELMAFHMMRFIKFQSEVWTEWHGSGSSRAAYSHECMRVCGRPPSQPSSYSTQRNEAVTNYVEGRLLLAPAEEQLQSMSLRCEE